MHIRHHKQVMTLYLVEPIEGATNLKNCGKLEIVSSYKFVPNTTTTHFKLSKVHLFYLNLTISKREIIKF